jgi:hypothetical protein
MGLSSWNGFFQLDISTKAKHLQDISGDAPPRLAEVKTDEEQTRPSTRLWQRMAFGAIVLISAFLNFLWCSICSCGAFGARWQDCSRPWRWPFHQSAW